MESVTYISSKMLELIHYNELMQLFCFLFISSYFNVDGMVPRNVILRLFATNFHGVKKNFYGTISLMKRSILIRKRRVIKVGLDGKA